MAAHSDMLAGPDAWLLELLTGLIVLTVAVGRPIMWLLRHPAAPAILQAASITTGIIAAAILTVDMPTLSVVILFGGVFGQALTYCWRWAGRP